MSTLTPVEQAHLQQFVSVLSGADGCPSTQASASLRAALGRYRPSERLLWRAPQKGVWRSLSVGQPCNISAKWWIDGNWRAAPMWAHCCNKGVGLARCPGSLLEAPSRCWSEKLRRQKGLKGHCESDTPLLCEAYFRAPQRHRGLIYSFGIADEWTFEDWAGSRGFDVHAFDPTRKTRDIHQSHRAEGVRFHYYGLGARGGAAGAFMPGGGRSGYGALGGEVLALDELQSRLGHGARPIHMLKIDCEGARRRPSCRRALGA